MIKRQSRKRKQGCFHITKKTETHMTPRWKVSLMLLRRIHHFTGNFSLSLQVNCRSFYLFNTVCTFSFRTLPFTRGSSPKHESCDLVLKRNCIGYTGLKYFTFRQYIISGSTDIVLYLGYISRMGLSHILKIWKPRPAPSEYTDSSKTLTLPLY